MIRKVFIADCDYCHQHILTIKDDQTIPMMITGFDGMRTALRSKGWYCGDGIAPQVLCPYCRKMKEEVNA